MTYSRPGMSYVPDIAIDENGQEYYSEGSVIIGQTGATVDPNAVEDLETGELEIVEDVIQVPEDLDAPEYIPEEVELVNVTEEIFNTPVIVNDEVADTIASVDLGNTPADVTTQYLAHQVYAGNLTAEEAFNEAIASGIAHSKLLSAFNRLKKACN